MLRTYFFHSFGQITQRAKDYLIDKLPRCALSSVSGWGFFFWFLLLCIISLLAIPHTLELSNRHNSASNGSGGELYWKVLIIFLLVPAGRSVWRWHEKSLIRPKSLSCNKVEQKRPEKKLFRYKINKKSIGGEVSFHWMREHLCDPHLKNGKANNHQNNCS